MRRPALSYANIMSTVGVFIALGGTSYAVAKLPKGSVGSDQLRADAVTNSKVADGAITTSKLAPGAAGTGPRGPRGPQGETGSAGPQGAAGPAASTTVEPWRAFTFENGWANYTSGLESASYRKDPYGVVHLRGTITKALGSPNQSVIATLPNGYHPANIRIVVAQAGPVAPGGTTPESVARLDIHPSGAIIWYSGPTLEADHISLEGISFDAAG